MTSDASLSEQPLDPTVLQEFREVLGDSSGRVVAELIDCYLTEAPIIFQSIQAAIEQKHLAGLQRAAHSLKASSAALGAMPLSHLCQALESLALTHDLSQLDFKQVDHLFANIKSEYDRVQLALQQEKQMAHGSC